MFHILHRFYVLSWILVGLVAAGWLYTRTGISEPLIDWYAVLQNKSNTPVQTVGELSGQVVKVVDGASVTVRATDRQLYNIALLGIIPPPVVPGTVETPAARATRAHLSDLVLSNDVTVTLTWIDPHRRGVGVVHLGETNINAAMVESGLVQFKREFVKGLPLLDQYALMRAHRRMSQAQPSSE